MIFNFHIFFWLKRIMAQLFLIFQSPDTCICYSHISKSLCTVTVQLTQFCMLSLVTSSREVLKEPFAVGVTEDSLPNGLWALVWVLSGESEQRNSSVLRDLDGKHHFSESCFKEKLGFPKTIHESSLLDNSDSINPDCLNQHFHIVIARTDVKKINKSLHGWNLWKLCRATSKEKYETCDIIIRKSMTTPRELVSKVIH